MTNHGVTSGSGVATATALDLCRGRTTAGSAALDQERLRAAAEPRRRLQLALACLWLLAAMLQAQAFMFGRGFGAMLRAAAAGNPPIVAGPIDWSARYIQTHSVAANAAFAAMQLAIALGIAWRPTLRVALGLSIVWSVAVWWLGEGLGGLVTGQASPVSGAPGAVLIYAVLAIALWPSPRQRAAPFVAGLAVGARAARLVWLVVWGSLAACALLPATTAPGAIGAMIAKAAAGQPAWLGHVDDWLAAAVSRGGLAAALVLTVILVIVAAGVYLPRPAARYVLVLAMVTAVALSLAQGLGGVLTGAGTDPGSGPPLALLALCYWPIQGWQRP